MCPMIDEYYTQPMYRDIMASGMGMPFMDPSMMGMYGAGYGMYNTNYLGGVTMRPKLNNDTFHIIKEKDKENSNMLKTIGKVALGVIGYMTAVTLLRGKGTSGFFSSIKSGASNSWNKFTGLFKKGTTP